MFLLFYCFLIGLFLRSYLVFILPVWFDEKVAITLARLPFTEILLHSTDVARPPLYYLFIKAWSIMSSHYIWFRFSTLILYCVNFFLIYRIGKKLNGEAFGRIASMLYSFSGYFIIFDWQIKPYTALLTCILLVFWNMIQRKMNKGTFVFLVLAGLFLDFGFLYMFVPMYLYFGYLSVQKNREAWWRVALLTLCFLVFAGFMIVIWKDFYRFTRETAWVGNYMDIRFTLPFIFGVSGVSQATIPIALLWIIGVMRAWLKDGFLSLNFFAYASGYVAFVIASLVSLVWIPIFHVRSLQIIGLCFLFGIAYGLRELYERGTLEKRIAIFVLILFLMNTLRVVFTLPDNPGIFLITFVL